MDKQRNLHEQSHVRTVNLNNLKNFLDPMSAGDYPAPSPNFRYSGYLSKLGEGRAAWKVSSPKKKKDKKRERKKKAERRLYRCGCGLFGH
jgi:hypothetical protein